MSFLKKHKTLILIVICVLVEILIANYHSISMLFGRYNQKELDTSSAVIEDEENVELKDGVMYISKGTIEFSDINEAVANICIASDSADGQYKKVEIAMTDDNFAYKDGFDYNHGTFYIYEAEGQKSYLSYSSYGEAKSLRITVSGDTVGTLAISSVSINTPQPFHICFWRLIIFIGIVLIVKFGSWKYTVSEYKYSRRILAGTAAAICLLTSICTIVLTKDQNTRLLSKYDPENMYSDDQYEELFYAFTQGKTSIDIDFDLTKFDGLDNVYDRSERNEKKAKGDYWDRAYYNGNFYSYFGVAPVITVYYPVYLLTGHVPTPVLASMILALYAQVFVSLLYIKVIRHMCSNAPLVLAVMGLPAVLSGSLILPLAFEFKFYFMAVLSGVGSVAAFLYFILGAYYAEKYKPRVIYLLLAGASVVDIAASRPTLVLYCFIAIIPGLFILKDRSVRRNLKLRYITAMITPVLLGAIMLMYYNYDRFDNPFEFGFNYQLTVSIAKANTIKLSMIPAALYHFFFQQPDFSTNFPYFHMRSRELELYPRYNYNGRLIGILNYPLTAFGLLLPFADKKKDKFKSAFLYSLAGTAVLLAFVDMCKAGTNYRYTADILMPLLIVGVAAMFGILDRLKEHSPGLYKKAYVLAAAVLFLTFMLGFLMMYCNESANLMKKYAFMSRFFYKG